MSPILKPKQTVHTAASNIPCEVEQFLAGGGQGEVYRASLGGRLVALKWYFPASATAEQRTAIEMLVKQGEPNDRFLWPMDLMVAQDVQGFGYIMPLREPRYKGMEALMKRRVEPSFRTLATVGLELSNSYLQLHSKGLCYRDISFGNVFFDPATGDIKICDNDNVGVDGKAHSSVLGTLRFMAPEIVRREALPSTKTDLFSLSVLLFYMFMLHHPLHGKKEAAIKCLDAAAEIKLCGTEPIFIFNPHDRSNEPLPGHHDNALACWPIYPQFLRDLFIKAFTDGIHDPTHGRVREGMWRAAMVRLRDAIIYCPVCIAENFYDTNALQSSSDKTFACWSCAEVTQLPFRIRIGKNIVMLNHDTQLFPHHVDDGKLYDFSQPIAAVTRHPTNRNLWGLKNLSTKKWTATKPDGTMQDVEVGRSIALATGTKIHFGATQGEIRY